MLAIENAAKSQAKNGQHVQFVTEIMADVPQEKAQKYGFITQWTAFSTAGGNEIAYFKQDRAYLATAEITDSDVFRDLTFAFYRDIIQAYANSCPDTEKQKAGKTLAFAFRETGNAARLDYTDETATLTDLVEKLRTEPYASALTTIGMEEAPDKIEEANEAFRTIYNERSTEVRQRAMGTSMKALRQASDKAFDELVQAINALYVVNEMVAKDPETRTELEQIINDVNDTVMNFRRILGMGSGSKDESEPTPEPTPVTPEITAVYQKEGGDPENPHRIERGEQTGVNYKGFTLKGQDGTLEHVIGLVNDQDYIEWINPETITNVTETSCEFTMVPDLTEGQYKVRIETYDGGSPLVVEYPEPITLW